MNWIQLNFILFISINFISFDPLGRINWSAFGIHEDERMNGRTDGRTDWETTVHILITFQLLFIVKKEIEGVFCDSPFYEDMLFRFSHCIWKVINAMPLWRMNDICNSNKYILLIRLWWHDTKHLKPIKCFRNMV